MKLIYGIKDKPKLSQRIVFAFQQVLAIMAATLAVPAVVNGAVGSEMDPAAALFGAGVGTIVYLLFTRSKSPVFLGSSFAFIGSMCSAFAGAASMALGYLGNTITVTCGTSVDTISVKDNSGDYLVDNSTYETKAKNYENKIAEEDENYHVVLAGSSSIEFWTSSKEDLDPVVSYNHGIGGTTIEEWDEKLNQRLVYPYKPKMVVYYVGINNVINSKQDATTIWNNLEKFFNDTHAALPDTKVQYIMMNLIPGYSSYWNVINTVNAKVTEYQQSNSWLTLINPGTALLKANGEPNAAYFRTDGLHLSYYGYVVWGGIIKESILRGLENN